MPLCGCAPKVRCKYMKTIQKTVRSFDRTAICKGRILRNGYSLISARLPVRPLRSVRLCGLRSARHSIVRRSDHTVAEGSGCRLVVFVRPPYRAPGLCGGAASLLRMRLGDQLAQHADVVADYMGLLVGLIGYVERRLAREHENTHGRSVVRHFDVGVDASPTMAIWSGCSP